MDNRTRTLIAKQLRQAAAKLEAGEGDYMALPTMLKAQDQIADTVLWLQQAEASGRRLEDWVEAKINSIGSDLEDLHTYVTKSSEAKL